MKMGDYWSDLRELEEQLEKLKEQLDAKKRRTEDANRNHKRLKESRDKLVDAIEEAYRELKKARQKHCESKDDDDEAEFEKWRHIFIGLDFWYRRIYERDVQRAWREQREAWREEMEALDRYLDKLLEVEALRGQIKRWIRARRERLHELCTVPIRQKSVALADLPPVVLALESSFPQYWPDILEILGANTFDLID